MNGNPMDDQIIQEVLQEVNGFGAAINQTRVGFINLFAQIMNRLANDYKNRGLMIQDQQKTIIKLNEHITNLGKELEVLRKSGE